MLRKLQQHPLLEGAGEVLTDAVRYVTVMLVLRRAARLHRPARRGLAVSRAADGEL